MSELDFAVPVGSWERVAPRVSPALAAARLQTHWASQLAAAAGAALVEPRSDFGHTSLTWDLETHSFLGEPLESGLRVTLHPASLTVALRDSRGEEQARLPLGGHRLDDGLVWLSESLRRTAMTPLEGLLTLLGHDMPAHELGQGGKFSSPAGEEYEELARWFGNAARFAHAVQASEEDASPVRCWPHHFDIATLIALDTEESNAEKARAIGFGMVPGDASYPEPYFYVNPWPPPRDAGTLPELDGKAHWHRAGWLGAVLAASELASVEALDQAKQVEAYLRSAMIAARRLLQA